MRWQVRKQTEAAILQSQGRSQNALCLVCNVALRFAAAGVLGAGWQLSGGRTPHIGLEGSNTHNPTTTTTSSKTVTLPPTKAIHALLPPPSRRAHTAATHQNAMQCLRPPPAAAGLLRPTVSGSPLRLAAAAPWPRRMLAHAAANQPGKVRRVLSLAVVPLPSPVCLLPSETSHSVLSLLHMCIHAACPKPTCVCRAPPTLPIWRAHHSMNWA